MIEVRIMQDTPRGPEHVDDVLVEEIPAVGHVINLAKLYSAKVIQVEWFPYKLGEATALTPTVLVRD